MVCKTMNLPGGGFAIVCGLPKPKACIHCGKPSSKLCDFPLTGAKVGSTCDRPLCIRCATHVDPDTDYCQQHARIVKEQSLNG